jgi:hypothetical protein
MSTKTETRSLEKTSRWGGGRGQDESIKQLLADARSMLVSANADANEGKGFP